jgi:hypothetical protein
MKMIPLESTEVNMTKKPSEIRGLLVHANKTFYYLESGQFSTANSLDRILKRLLAKDIISYTGTREDVTEEKYRPLTLQEAQEKGYAVEVFYLNAHVKTNCGDTPTPENKVVSWGKKGK